MRNNKISKVKFLLYTYISFLAFKYSGIDLLLILRVQGKFCKGNKVQLALLWFYHISWALGNPVQ